MIFSITVQPSFLSLIVNLWVDKFGHGIHGFWQRDPYITRIFKVSPTVPNDLVDNAATTDNTTLNLDPFLFETGISLLSQPNQCLY